MKVFVRNTSLDGKPLTGDGDVFTGERPLDVVMAMKGAALFSDHGNVAEYVDMVLRNAKMLAGKQRTHPLNKRIQLRTRCQAIPPTSWLQIRHITIPLFMASFRITSMSG